MTSFKKIITPRIRLADEVYKQIIDAIHLGKIDPQKRIIQEKLAAELEISRTPVREALMRLEQEGILEISGRGGFAIRHIKPKEVFEIYQARAAIEGYAIHLLTEKGNQQYFAQIAAIITLEENRNLNNASDYYDANKNIHRAFIVRTSNQYLLEMFDQMWSRGFSFHLFAAISKNEMVKSLGSHMMLCDVMRNGDALAAESAMRSHIQDGLEMQLAALN